MLWPLVKSCWVPVQTDYLALKGLERMSNTLRMVARGGRGLGSPVDHSNHVRLAHHRVATRYRRAEGTLPGHFVGMVSSRLTPSSVMQAAPGFLFLRSGRRLVAPKLTQLCSIISWREKNPLVGKRRELSPPTLKI